MEIITHVLQGAITHEDSLGHKGRTEAGDVQVMSAGSGIRHAEYNRESVPTRIFQIWIEPEKQGGEPSWGAKPFPKADRAGHFVPLASGFADDDDALPIRAEARVLGATLKAGDSAEYQLSPDRHAYLVPAVGSVDVNGVRIDTRDGAAIAKETVLKVKALEDAEVLRKLKTTAQAGCEARRALRATEQNKERRQDRRERRQPPGAAFLLRAMPAR
jgi:redox-sensitive bicupin YhaK (pirin superfamily)